MEKARDDLEKMKRVMEKLTPKEVERFQNRKPKLTEQEVRYYNGLAKQLNGEGG